MIVMYDEMNATINVYVVGDLVSDPPRDKPTNTVGYALNGLVTTIDVSNKYSDLV